MLPTTAEKLQNFFGVFLQFQIGVDSGKLTAHLLDIDKTASKWMDRMLPQMMKAAGVTEELKARNQMAWIGLVNNCKAQVEEIIFSDLIYV